ncbi:MAG: hypothetical protein QOF48_3518 [Verrucomicrobiota bacterium]|jgi:PAS domain S-box-containing protein
MHTDSITDKTWLDTELCQRELLRAIPVAIYTCDKAGIITFCNEAAAFLWGRKPVIGHDSWCGSWKIFKRDGSPMPLADCPMAVALREGRPVHGEEIIVERPDGTKRFVLPHPQPIRDRSGGLVGAVNTLMDLTESETGRTALQSIYSVHGRKNGAAAPQTVESATR